MISTSFKITEDQLMALKRQAEREGIVMDELIRDVLAHEADRILRAEALERYDEPSPPYRPRSLGI